MNYDISTAWPILTTVSVLRPAFSSRFINISTNLKVAKLLWGSEGTYDVTIKRRQGKRETPAMISNDPSNIYQYTLI